MSGSDDDERERDLYSMMHGIHTPPYSSTVDIVPHKTTRPYIPHNMSLNNEMTRDSILRWPMPKEIVLVKAYL